MVELQTVGRFFREQREKAGLTREFVARRLESVSASELAAFEDGGGSLAVDDLFGLTNLLNVDPEHVLRLLQPAAIQALEADVARRIRDAEAKTPMERKSGEAAIKITGQGGAS